MRVQGLFEDMQTMQITIARNALSISSATAGLSRSKEVLNFVFALQRLDLTLQNIDPIILERLLDPLPARWVLCDRPRSTGRARQEA